MVPFGLALCRSRTTWPDIFCLSSYVSIRLMVDVSPTPASLLVVTYFPINMTLRSCSGWPSFLLLTPVLFLLQLACLCLFLLLCAIRKWQVITITHLRLVSHKLSRLSKSGTEPERESWPSGSKSLSLCCSIVVSQ